MKLILAPKRDGDRDTQKTGSVFYFRLDSALNSVFGINTLFQLVEVIRRMFLTSINNLPK